MGAPPEPAAAATAAATVTRLGPGQAPTTGPDRLAVEAPVALRYNAKSHVVMMATPTDLEDFAFGFSLAEAVVADMAEIEAVATTTAGAGIELAITIPAERARRLTQRQRNLAGRTGCGLCGVGEIEAALRLLPRVAAGTPIGAVAIDRALAELPARQKLNRQTGAVHAAAFATPEGEIRAVREDVGRHNALDKLIGALARARIDPASGFAVITSRCSMEMVQKAATFGIPVLVAVSAPTALAVELAEAAGLTVCAFARGQGCNVYSRAERIGG